MRWLAGLMVVMAVSAGCGERTDGPDGTAGGPEGSTEWRRLPDGPLSGRTGAVAVGVGDRAYVFGGWKFLCPPSADCTTPEGPLMADGAVLDTSTGEWQRIADAPFGVRSAATTVLGSHIYVVSGCRGKPHCFDGPLELLRYDTVADRWDELGRLPGVKNWYPTLHAIGDRVLALSTSDEQGEVADVLYDPGAEEWTALPDDPLPPVYDRHAVIDGARLLVFGSPRVGPDEEGAPKVGAAYDLTSGEWTRLPDAPGKGYQVWRSGDRAFLNPHFGPDGGGLLDLDSDTWRPLPVDVSRGDRYDLAGLIGDNAAIYEYSHGWALDARDDTFIAIPERPSTAYDESRTAVGQDLLVFGGQDWGEVERDGSSDMKRGELVAETWLWSPPRT